jgi:hypothetical protein
LRKARVIVDADAVVLGFRGGRGYGFLHHTDLGNAASPQPTYSIGENFHFSRLGARG